MWAGALIVLGTICFAGVLVGLGWFLDRVRKIGPDEAFLGWYRGKTNSRLPQMYSGVETDTMDDHGNRDADGGL